MASDSLQMDLDLEGHDWTPTPHGELMARALAEHDLVSGRDVLELGAGSGNHTILLLRRGAKSVVATESSQERLETTRRNVERNVDPPYDVEYRVADWLDTEGRFDLVASNPPFCKSGKRNRRYFIDSLILDAHRRLRPEGELLFVQSSMADVGCSLRRLEENGWEAEIVDSSTGPFRDYYFEDESFMREIQRVPNGFELKDGEYIETLYMISCRLRAWPGGEGR